MLTPSNIDDFWKLETIGITPQEEKEHDEVVMDHFKNSMVDTMLHGHGKIRTANVLKIMNSASKDLNHYRND